MNERSTYFDRSICPSPCSMMHTRYVDGGEVADPGGCYWGKHPGIDIEREEPTPVFRGTIHHNVNLNEVKAPGTWTVEDADDFVKRYEQGDPVNPSHYELPGGEQVSWISRYLTSNSGQAVQYTVRSSRVDGNNKSRDVQGRIEDLRKAVWFLEDEISRLEEEGDK